MRLSTRSRRRLIVLGSICATLVVGLLVFKYVRGVVQDQLVAEARADGLAAYVRGDDEATLDRLSYFIQHDKRDVEVLLAFADARRRVTKVNNEHLLEAVGYYAHALRVLDADPGGADHAARTRLALESLLDLRGRLGHRVEMLIAADRLLDLKPDHVAALRAKASLFVAERRFAEARPVAERLIEVEPEQIGWRHLRLEVMRGEGASEDEILRTAVDWAEHVPGDGRFYMLAAAWAAEQGHPDRARPLIEQAAARGAGDIDVLGQMVALLDLLGRSALAGE
ncbi:MAG: hypothetical protein KDA25_11100, partial [Phycisphaerales bacterium]|nr:hypothetical protein [Phycisphaerales bacterium]